jgi:hypothetical protein
MNLDRQAFLSFPVQAKLITIKTPSTCLSFKSQNISHLNLQIINLAMNGSFNLVKSTIRRSLLSRRGEN